MKLKIPPPIVTLICGVLMWAIAYYGGAWRLYETPSLPVMVAAALLVGVGLALDLVSVADFIKAKTTVTPLTPDKASQLVLGGPYRFTRNPMYLGMLLILSGAALWLGAPLNLLVLAGFVGYLTTFQIKPEERALLAKFGEEYRSYMGRVRRWL